MYNIHTTGDGTAVGNRLWSVQKGWNVSCTQVHELYTMTKSSTWQFFHWVGIEICVNCSWLICKTVVCGLGATRWNSHQLVCGSLTWVRYVSYSFYCWVDVNLYPISSIHTWSLRLPTLQVSSGKRPTWMTGRQLASRTGVTKTCSTFQRSNVPTFRVSTFQFLKITFPIFKTAFPKLNHVPKSKLRSQS